VNVYVRLTSEFNRGRIRAMISSGQAVVLYKLAIMSKDGDWIVREDAEATAHILEVLASHGAAYRFGAPLDERWLRGGWSSHMEYREGPLRIRTDFVTRPPRLSPEALVAAWQDGERRSPPVLGIRELAEIKKTNREKDYAVIGELARRIADVPSQFLWSRSARDLIRLAEDHPDDWVRACDQRPLLKHASDGLETLEAALDAERRQLMHANERRLQAYRDVALDWAAAWPDVSRAVAGMPLPQAHAYITEHAEGVLPFAVS
jgi:hypothetical protein